VFTLQTLEASGHLTRHPFRWRLVAQKAFGFAMDKIRAGIVFGGLYRRTFVNPGSTATLLPSLKIHADFARLLIKTQRRIEYNPYQEECKQAPDNSRFWHTDSSYP